MCSIGSMVNSVFNFSDQSGTLPGSLPGSRGDFLVKSKLSPLNDTSYSTQTLKRGHKVFFLISRFAQIDQERFCCCQLYEYLSLVRNIDRFLTDVSILYPLKTLENPRFSGVFMGYKMGTLCGNGLNLKN